MGHNQVQMILVWHRARTVLISSVMYRELKDALLTLVKTMPEPKNEPVASLRFRRDTKNTCTSWSDVQLN
jgi:hypothetical protein